MVPIGTAGRGLPCAVLKARDSPKTSQALRYNLRRRARDIEVDVVKRRIVG